jgi:hypothetical protein
MARQPRAFKPWWSSPEEERLALDELHDALEKQRNDKDYHKKIHEHVKKLVDELGSNENFQKMITGIYTPPVFIGENSDTQDELIALFEAADREKEEKAKLGGNYNSKNTKKPNSKRRKSIRNKTSKSKEIV